MLKSFFSRNSPLFYIGIATAVIFTFIIIAGNSNQNEAPSLNPINQENLNTDHNFILGDSNARVTIVEFLDYNCPFCKSISPTIKNLVNNNPGKVRVYIKHLPLTGNQGHEFSKLAAQAVQAAGKMGKFLEMHDSLIDMQDINREKIIERAESLGINKEEFVSIMDSQEIVNQVEKDVETAKNLQISGTPTIFLNGIRVDLRKSDLNTLVLVEVNKAYPTNWLPFNLKI